MFLEKKVAKTVAGSKKAKITTPKLNLKAQSTFETLKCLLFF
jgi:hypothetical protein